MMMMIKLNNLEIHNGDQRRLAHVAQKRLYFNILHHMLLPATMASLHTSAPPVVYC